MKKFSWKPLFVISIVIIGMIFFSRPAEAANEDRILELRKQIAELQVQADKYRNSVLSNREQADTLARQIQNIENSIKRLETDIVITEREIETTGLEIVQVNDEIYDTEKDIIERKKAVSDAIFEMYQQDQLTTFAILLQNPQLSDMADEVERINGINKRLTILLQELQVKQEQLSRQREELATKKNSLEVLNDSQINQQRSLEGSKVSKDELLEDTRGEEVRYQALLNDAERRKAAFFEELQELERNAKATGSVITHVIASNVPPKGTVLFEYPYDKYVLTQGFGYTSFAKSGAYNGAAHNGIDIVAGYGSPIQSIGAGEVLSGGTNTGWGNWIAIKHDNGMVSLYGHMNAPARLSVGTRVTKDSVIGYEGKTGFATGSHLHLSLYRDYYTYINPKSGEVYFNYFEGTLNPFDYLP